MLDPRSINSKKFKETRLAAGYDQDEVDAFLDDCAATVGELHRQIADLTTRLNVAAQQSAAGSSLAGIEKLLTVAQQTADQTKAEAEHAAATKVAEATDKANVIMGNAYSRADQIKAEAEARARSVAETAAKDASDTVNAARAERDAVKAHHDQLCAARDGVLAVLRQTLNVAQPDAVNVITSLPVAPASEAQTTIIPAIYPGTDVGSDDEGNSA